MNVSYRLRYEFTIESCDNLICTGLPQGCVPFPAEFSLSQVITSVYMSQALLSNIQTSQVSIFQRTVMNLDKTRVNRGLQLNLILFRDFIDQMSTLKVRFLMKEARIIATYTNEQMNADS